MMLVMGLAPIVAPILGGYMLVVGDWRMIFWFQAAVGAAIGLWCFFRLGESRSEAVREQALRENPLAAYFALLRQPRLIGYALSGAFNAGAFFSWLSFAPLVLIEIYHISPQNFGWVFGINAFGFIAMNQINAHLLRWYTPEEILVRARLVSIIFAVVLVIDAWTGFGGMLGVLIPLYLTLGSFGFVGPNTQAAALNVDPTRTGAASSLVGATAFATGALISSLSGYLNDGTVRPLATMELVLILLSSAALYGVAKPLAAPQKAS
jgi:DHA1 family bicyclomycin/chloramphenicol resistance-like MFS transporter